MFVHRLCKEWQGNFIAVWKGEGGSAMKTYQHGGRRTNMSRVSKRVTSVLISAAAAAITLFSVAVSAADRNTQEQEEGRLQRAGNGPGPAANGPGPGCNIIPPLASIGTKVDISQFPP